MYACKILHNPTLGVDAITLNEPLIKLYPNPVKDRLFISSTKQINKLTIYNTNGQLIKQLNNTNNGIDVSQSPIGFYLIEAKTQTAKHTLNFVKTK